MSSETKATTPCGNGQRRRAGEEEEEEERERPPQKRLKVQDGGEADDRDADVDADADADAPAPAPAPAPAGAGPPSTALLNLSDDVLMLILRHLSSSYDLVHLSSCCRRLERVCRDKSLWVDVAAVFDPSSSSSFQSLREIRRLLAFLHNGTRSVRVGGNLNRPVAVAVARREVVSPSLLQECSRLCPQLAELALERCYLDAKKVSLDTMPTSIISLSLADSEVVNIKSEASYFHGIHEALPNLHRLILSGCGWLSSHSLMAIAKLPLLEELDLRGCRRMGDVFAYTALATRWGFQKLERLDMRDTNITDTEWQCFGRLPSIKKFLAGRTLDGNQTETDERLNDRALACLAALVQQSRKESPLEEIGLTGTGVTDGSMAAAGKAFVRLRVMDVRGTRVGEGGACAVAKVRPKCQVLFDPEKTNPLAGKPPVTRHNPEEFILIQAPQLQ